VVCICCGDNAKAILGDKTNLAKLVPERKCCGGRINVEATSLEIDKINGSNFSKYSLIFSFPCPIIFYA
jgi:hypothetical protein